MSKSVLISIQPKWCELIANGKKTIEVRKSAPKLETPFKCYIYCTNGNGTLNDTLMSSDRRFVLNKKVIGEFVCDRIDEYILILDYNGDNYSTRDFMYYPLKDACLSQDEIVDYGAGKDLYGWHISDLKIYDEPKELSEFRKPCSQKQCASWCKDMKVEHAICLNKDKRFMTRPPQSWCYCEELEK